MWRISKSFIDNQQRVEIFFNISRYVTCVRVTHLHEVRKKERCDSDICILMYIYMCVYIYIHNREGHGKIYVSYIVERQRYSVGSRNPAKGASRELQSPGAAAMAVTH